MKVDWKKLFIAIAVCQLAGIIGSLFTTSSISTWYQFLIKPSFNPPNWLFGPVWLFLYVLMGISFYLVLRAKEKAKQIKKATVLFVVHLIFNSLWSLVFFGLRNIFMGLVVIIVLWLLIVAVIVKFRAIDKKTIYYLIPYLLWASFATFLNYSIWILNR